ncbi:MAG TPA: hypothetical protein IGS31_21155, partial [Oscillatoriales cyanobacterium M4454_W2019_049]|nr:hypothetical protein [Oscillatoriales cyanobacterium M4454_W2019_049]
MTDNFFKITLETNENLLAIDSYGNQDRNSSISFSDDLTQVDIVGNGWKKVDLGNGYTITENTILEFDFQST